MTRIVDLIWRRNHDDCSFELMSLDTRPDGFDLRGTVLLAEAGEPLRIDYRIVCDADWQTALVEVNQLWRNDISGLRLEHDGLGNWRRDGAAASHLQGCTDVDLSVSPSTNALPINRLGLAEGEERNIRAAWILFPSLEVRPSDQSYQRIGPKDYVYRSLQSSFTAQLSVDESGLPIDYGAIWSRIATTSYIAKPSLPLDAGANPGS